MRTRSKGCSELGQVPKMFVGHRDEPRVKCVLGLVVIMSGKSHSPPTFPHCTRVSPSVATREHTCLKAELLPTARTPLLLVVVVDRYQVDEI